MRAVDRLKPWHVIAALMSSAALADAANCIRLGHADWWMPTAARLRMCAVNSAGG